MPPALADIVRGLLEKAPAARLAIRRGPGLGIGRCRQVRRAPRPGPAARHENAIGFGAGHVDGDGRPARATHPAFRPPSPSSRWPSPSSWPRASSAGGSRAPAGDRRRDPGDPSLSKPAGQRRRPIARARPGRRPHRPPEPAAGYPRTAALGYRARPQHRPAGSGPEARGRSRADRHLAAGRRPRSRERPAPVGPGGPSDLVHDLRCPGGERLLHPGRRGDARARGDRAAALAQRACPARGTGHPQPRSLRELPSGPGACRPGHGCGLLPRGGSRSGER